MSDKEFDLNEWSAGGGSKFERKTFLKDWKSEPSHRINIFLHTKAGIAQCYRHSFWKVYDAKDKDTGVVTRKLQFTTLNCHEDLNVSYKQSKREIDGSRTVPPKHCPFCKLSEHVRTRVMNGDLSWTAPVFEFQGQDFKGNTITRRIFAGGLYGAFSGDKLTDEQKSSLRAGGLEPKDAWKENHVAKNNVVLRVVDYDDVAKGVQIAFQPTSVGDAIKKVIRDTKESLGDEEGNPVRNPYCIQLDYHKDEPVFSKKYEARHIAKNKMTDAVKALIVDTAAPDLGFVVEPFDAEKLRPSLEKACLIKGVPWDEIFADAKKVAEDGQDDGPPPERKTTPAPAAKAEIKAAPTQVAAEDECDCDVCGKPMKLTDKKCPHCGHVYEAEEAPPPPPPVKRSRSSAKASPAPAKAAQREPGDDSEPTDELPF
jgi:hypothetical protein